MVPGYWYTWGLLGVLLGKVLDQITQMLHFSFLSLDRRLWLFRKHCLRSSSLLDLEQDVP